jgi:hypothetical protein
MRNHDHSIIRFIIDLIQIAILLAILLSPIYLIISLNVKDLDLKAEVTQAVAGAKSQR